MDFTKLLLSSIPAAWLALCAHAQHSVPAAAPAAGHAAELPQVPALIVENIGQTDARARFLAYTGSLHTYFCRDAFALRMHTPSGSAVGGANLWLHFEGAGEGAQVAGGQRAPALFNYFLGNDPKQWHTGAPTYETLVYTGLYPGVGAEFSLRTHGDYEGRIEYDLVLQPGADLSAVVMRAEGATHMSLDGSGALVIDTAAGELRQELPLAWYETQDGKRETTACTFRLIDEQRYGFAAEPGPAGARLVIDPTVIYGSYVGGLSAENGTGIAADNSASAFVTGASLSANFPATAGAFDTTVNNEDVVVFKMDPLGSTLLYATFLGGTGYESGHAIGADPFTSQVVVTGQTLSPDFPTTAGAVDTSYNGDLDAFAVRLNATGSALVFSTYLGGSAADIGNGIITDAFGNSYVVGSTTSADFPATAGSFAASLSGIRDGFALKLGPGGTSMPFATFLGGSSTDSGLAVALRAGSEMFVAGQTGSSDFPTTAGAFDTTFANGEGFVSHLSADGSSLLGSTFLGGSELDSVHAIDFGLGSDPFVTGRTESVNFPTTPGAFDTSFSGGSEAFVVHLRSNLATVFYSTFLGGSANDEGNGIVVDPVGFAFVVGTTSSANFPIGGFGTIQAVLAGSSDAFTTILYPNGSILEYSSFNGGPQTDEGLAIALDYLTYASFITGSAGDNFPNTAGAFAASFSGCTSDAFVVRLDPQICQTAATTAIKGTGCGATLSSTLPIQGQQLTLTIQGPPSSTALVYSSLATGTNFPFETCEIGLDLTTLNKAAQANTNASGQAQVLLPVFNDPTRCGQQILFQAVILNAVSGPATFGAVTNGIVLTLGS